VVNAPEQEAGATCVSWSPTVLHLFQPKPGRFLTRLERARTATTSRYVAATPLAGVVAKASDHARAALITEIGAALKSSVDHQGLAFPIVALGRQTLAGDLVIESWA
jgi:hypothetical protein